MQQIFKSVSLILIGLYIVSLCLKDVQSISCIDCSDDNDIQRCKAVINETSYNMSESLDLEHSPSIGFQPDGGEGDGTFEGKDVTACVPKSFQLFKVFFGQCFWSPELGCTGLEINGKLGCSDCFAECPCAALLEQQTRSIAVPIHPGAAWAFILPLGAAVQWIY